jgi:hypothetical protein
VSPDRDRESRRGSGLDVLTSIAAATAGVGAVTALAAILATKVAIVDVLIGAGVALYLGVGAFVGRMLLRTRYYAFRIAVTGKPEAGKTVFSYLLFDQLMNGNDSDFEFTAESRSAIATYQAVRGMTQEEWPPSTVSGDVRQFDGSLRHGRVVVDSEIGDSAGQHWMQLSQGSDQESDYLQWVLSAQALAHVIPVDRMVDEGFDSALREDVADLRLAAKLMRNVSRDRHLPVPILIVISKMDLLDVPLAESELMRIFTGAEAETLQSTQAVSYVAKTDVAGLLVALSQELLADYRSVSFMYSSVEVVRRLRRIGAPRRPDIAEWTVMGAATSGRRGLLGLTNAG